MLHHTMTDQDQVVWCQPLPRVKSVLLPALYGWSSMFVSWSARYVEFSRSVSSGSVTICKTIVFIVLQSSKDLLSAYFVDFLVVAFFVETVFLLKVDSL